MMFISKLDFDRLQTDLKYEREERWKLNQELWELEKKLFSLAKTLGYQLQEPSKEMIWEQVVEK